MPLFQCMRTVSQREYLIYEQSIVDEMNSPSRSDYYLMQLASEIRMIFDIITKREAQKRPESKFQIPFSLKSPKPKPKSDGGDWRGTFDGILSTLGIKKK